MSTSRIWLADGEKMYTIDTAEKTKKWVRVKNWPKNLGKRIALLPQTYTNRIYICSLDEPVACLFDVELGTFEDTHDILPAKRESFTGDKCVFTERPESITLFDTNMWPKLDVELGPAYQTRQSCANIGNGTYFMCGGVRSTGRCARCHIITEKGAREVAPMRQARSHHICITLPNDRVMVAGGLVDYERPVILHVEIYDIKADKWFDAAPMMYPRYNAAAVLIDDGKSVLVFGGLLSTPKEMLRTEAEKKNHQDQFIDVCEIYDIEANVWRFAPEYNLFVTFNSPQMCAFAPPKK
jgi:hypothetical protein